MSIGCVLLMKEIKKLPCFLYSSSFLATNVKLEGNRRGGGQHHSAEKPYALLSALKGEDVAGIFGQTHKKVTGTESSVNQPKERGFDSAAFSFQLLARCFIWGIELRLSPWPHTSDTEADLPVSFSHGEWEQVILFGSAALKNKHGSTGIQTAEIPHKMCLLHTVPKPCSQSSFELRSTHFYSCSEQPPSPRQTTAGEQGQRICPTAPLPGPYSLSYEWINHHIQISMYVQM